MNQHIKVLITLVILPLLILLTGCDSNGAFSESMAKLERIDITASPLTTRGVSELTLAAGNKLPLEAVGYYSDGASRTLTNLTVNDWHTNNKDVGYFNVSGVLIGGDTPGLASVYVLKDGVTSNVVNINVTAAVITNITLTPSPVKVAKGQTQKLAATAIYSDNTSSDVTDSVTWQPVDTATTTVTPDGLLAGVEVGSTTLTASKDGITSNVVTVNVTSAIITMVTVTPSIGEMAKGQT